jgi:hypothetical protein
VIIDTAEVRLILHFFQDSDTLVAVLQFVVADHQLLLKSPQFSR